MPSESITDQRCSWARLCARKYTGGRERPTSLEVSQCSSVVPFLSISPKFLFLYAFAFYVLDLGEARSDRSLVLSVLREGLFHTFRITLSSHLYRFLVFLRRGVSYFAFFRVFCAVAVGLLARVIRCLSRPLVVEDLVGGLVRYGIDLHGLGGVSLYSHVFGLLNDGPRSPRFFFDRANAYFLGDCVLGDGAGLRGVVRVLLYSVNGLNAASQSRRCRAFLLRLARYLSSEDSTRTGSLYRHGLRRSLAEFRFTLRSYLARHVGGRVPW